MRSFKVIKNTTSLFFAGVALLLLSSCEKCSNCTINYSNALCECNLGGGLIQIFNIDEVTDDELVLLKADCETMGDCKWKQTTSEQTQVELCGKTNELDNRVAFLSNDGWSCN